MKFFQVLEIDYLTLKCDCFILNVQVYFSDMVLTDKDLEKKHGEKIFHVMV
jgi:hypothetical protein